MRVYVVTDHATKSRYALDAAAITAVCIDAHASEADLEDILGEPADACVVCCEIHPDARRVLQAVAPLTRGSCVILDCAYSNVFRLFDLRDVWGAWDHVALVGESDDGGSTLPVYHMGATASRESTSRVVAALFHRARTRECADLFESHLFACGPSVAALLPPSDVGLVLKEIHDMRTIVRERATLCASLVGSDNTVDTLGTWAYCRVLWHFRKTQLMLTAPRPPILWDILLFFYCVCRTFSLPCNQIGANVHHGELRGLTGMMTDRKYIMRADTVCTCLHWLHCNHDTRVSCVVPMACTRTIDVRGCWIYALQPTLRPERADASVVDARRAEWSDKPVPVRFLAYDESGDVSIRTLFPSARSVRRVATVDMAFRAACERKRPGVTVVSGIGVLSNVAAALYARALGRQWSDVHYAPADGVFLRMDLV